MSGRLRIALALAAAWVAVSIAMWLVPATNFRTVDEVLAPGYRSELEAAVAPLGAGGARPVLRYLASELNRRFFAAWALAQGVLALVLFALVASDPEARRGDRALAGVAAALVAVLSLGLAPALRARGPALDFVPRPWPPEWQEAASAFLRLHGVYMAADLAKLLVVSALLVRLLRFRPRRRGRDAFPGE